MAARLQGMAQLMCPGPWRARRHRPVVGDELWPQRLAHERMGPAASPRTRAAGCRGGFATACAGPSSRFRLSLRLTARDARLRPGRTGGSRAGPEGWTMRPARPMPARWGRRSWGERPCVWCGGSP